MEHENLGIDVNGEATSGLTHEGESTDAPRPINGELLSSWARRLAARMS